MLPEITEYRALNKGSGRYDLITSSPIQCVDNSQYFFNETQFAKDVGMYACYTTTWVPEGEQFYMQFLCKIKTSNHHQ